MPPLAYASYHSTRKFLTSQTITLQPSDTNTSFQVHEHLLLSISPVLLAAISREWKEKTKRRYKFGEDMTEELLLHFLMWAYGGSYPDTNGNKTVEVKYMSFETWLNAQKRKPLKKDSMVKRPEREVSGMPVKVHVDGQVEEPANDKQKAEQSGEGSENLHPLLLHAKLYVFAEMYMIEPLKKLSMEKLIVQLHGLGSLAEDHERAAVSDVLTFAFSSRVPENDVLLHWLARYASWMLDELRQMPSSFDKLLLQTD
ncbi:hypothetical protein MMC31_007444, partial [Peltigera leucophlebia]|nr:hypothetical protein [Peltigera leucophlebia]